MKFLYTLTNWNCFLYSLSLSNDSSSLVFVVDVEIDDVVDALTDVVGEPDWELVRCCCGTGATVFGRSYFFFLKKKIIYLFFKIIILSIYFYILICTNSLKQTKRNFFKKELFYQTIKCRTTFLRFVGVVVGVVDDDEVVVVVDEKVVVDSDR